jgi:hypothetical protein
MPETISNGPPQDSKPSHLGKIGQFIRCVLPRQRWILIAWVAALAASLAVTWLGWPIAAKGGFLAFEIAGSLWLVRIFADLSQWRQLRRIGRILAALWIPLGVAAVAAWLLFRTSQGRELGVGLMDEPLKTPFLALVLLYWALNNSLSARIGLVRAFEPEDKYVLFHWAPRSIGVLAHLLAAVSLSFAASSHVQGIVKQSLVFVLAPLAVLLATVLGGLTDHGYISRGVNEEKQRVTRKWMYLGVVIELLLFVSVERALREAPRGYFWGTVSTAVSAYIFIVLIGWLRRKFRLDEGVSQTYREKPLEYRLVYRKEIWIWTWILGVLMLIGTIVIGSVPMRVGQVFGSLIIACFSFGSFLALINLLDYLAHLLAATYAEKKAGFPVEARSLAAVFFCFLALWALLHTLTHRPYPVRLCNEKECTAAEKFQDWSAVEAPDKRPTVPEAVRAWYAQAEPVYREIYPEKPVPMLIVATAGGGIRAAYWTATILERLEKDLSLEAFPGKEIHTENLMRNLLFAISGVSGGSVGAAAYAAAVHDHAVNRTRIEPTKYLREDFLAPGIASMVFIDGPLNVLPDFGQIDRGEALERGFELASRTEKDKEELVSHKFLSFFPVITDKGPKLRSWRPALLLNATHEGTGRRIITSHIQIEDNVFLDSDDALTLLNSDMRLSTAAHNSARFSFVSPAGNLISAKEPGKRLGYVIDGGYFENYGAETALELARAALDVEISDKGKKVKLEKKVKLVVLQISSDPSLMADCIVRSATTKCNSGATESKNGAKGWDLSNLKDEVSSFVSSYFNDLLAPVVGSMSIRQAQSTVAAEELAAWIGEQGKSAANTTEAPHFSHIAMCKDSSINPPLGWVLSNSTREKFAVMLDQEKCGNKQELALLEQALGLPFPTSPAQSSP